MTDKNRIGSNVEVADIFREHIADYLERYRIPPEHYKVCTIFWTAVHHGLEAM